MRLRRSIAAAQRMLQKNPKCDWSRAGFDVAKETLQRLIVSKNNMLLRSSATWWSKNGDKVNQQIFKYKKPRTNDSYKPKLIKEDGSLLEDVAEIMEAVTNHYNGFSSSYSICPNNLHWQNLYWRECNTEFQRLHKISCRGHFWKRCPMLWRVYVEHLVQASMDYQEIFLKILGGD